MILLPIVARELRVASRRRATYWTRFSAGVIAIVVCSFVWATLFRQSSKDTGLALFVATSIIAYIYSLLAGAHATADSVSEEKREGTLGLLFLTDLKSYDIVLGKLAASSLTAIYSLLAIFPVMGVPLLLGGVAPAEFWRVVIVCLNSLFLSLAIGLLCSAICKDERKAIGLTVGIIVVLTAGVPGIVAWIASEIHSGHPLYQLFHQNPEPLLVVSPGFAAVFAFDDPYKAKIAGAKVNWFHVSLAMTHCLAWSALALTAIILPRVWQDKAASQSALRRREKWKQWTLGNDAARSAFRRGLLEINPFYWLAARERFKFVLVWLVLGAGTLLWLAGLADDPRNWLNEGIYIFTALAVHTVFKCWIAMEAPRRLGTDRRSGALELIISTPLTVNEILRGQWRALARQFAAPVAVVCAVDLLFLSLGLKHNYSAGDREMWSGIWLLGIIIFVLDLVTIPPLAVWLSLAGRKTGRAGTSAFVLVCCLPWIAFAGFAAFMTILQEVFHLWQGWNDPGPLFLGAWFVFSVLNDLLFGGWAMRNLQTKFRLAATQRLESRRALLGRWLGRKYAETRR
jgi:ABC-type transport system involved in multi-copper enzyme maturation permease subunit